MKLELWSGFDYSTQESLSNIFPANINYIMGFHLGFSPILKKIIQTYFNLKLGSSRISLLASVCF